MSITISVAVPCPWCLKEATLEVPFEGYQAWQRGDLVQNALPDLSADEREMLISGVCPACWDEQFGSDEE